MNFIQQIQSNPLKLILLLIYGKQRKLIQTYEIPPRQANYSNSHMQQIRQIVSQIKNQQEKQFCVLIYKYLTKLFNINLQNYSLEKWLYGQINWFCFPEQTENIEIDFENFKKEVCQYLQFLIQSKQQGQKINITLENLLSVFILINQMINYTNNEINLISLYKSIQQNFNLYTQISSFVQQIQDQNFYNLLIKTIKTQNLYKIRQILYLMDENNNKSPYYSLQIFSYSICMPITSPYNCKHIQNFINEITENKMQQLINNCQINIFTIIYFIQILLSQRKNSFYQNLLGQQNKQVIIYIETLCKQYFKIQNENIIHYLITQMVNMIKQEQEFIRRNQILYTTFKLIDNIYYNKVNSLLQNDLIDSNIRNLFILIQNQVDSTVIEEISPQYQQIIDKLPNNKYFIDKLPVNTKIHKISELLTGIQDLNINNIQKNITLLYITYDNQISIINNIFVNIHININVFDQIYRKLISQAQKANEEQFSQQTIKIDKQLIEFSIYGKYLLFHSLFGFIFYISTKLNQQLYELLKQLNDKYQKYITNDILKHIHNSLIYLFNSMLNDKIKKQTQTILITEFIFQIFETKQQKQMYQDLIDQIYYQIFDNKQNLQIDSTCLQYFYLQNKQIIDQMLKCINYQDIQQQLIYLVIDPQIQRYPLESMFNYVIRANIVQKQKNQQQQKNYEYYIDPRLTNTKQALLPVLKQWTKINDLKTFIPKDTQLFYYGGHGTAQFKVDKIQQMPSSILMGCSSLVEVYVNRFCSYENRLIYNTAPFTIGCIFDMLSSELDLFSKDLLQLIDQQKEQLTDEIIYQLVNHAKSKINLQGLVGMGIVLYCRIEV